MLSTEHRPRFTDAQAVDLADRLYGLEATARPLPSDRDQNFLLTTPDGAQYVLKIASADEQEEVLAFQHAAMARLSRPGYPQVQPTKTGDRLTKVDGQDGLSHFVRLVTYLPGTPLGDVRPHTPELLRSLGAFLGQTDRTLEGFDHPGAHRTLDWDLKHAVATIARFAPHIDDPDRRALVGRYLKRFVIGAGRILPDLRTGVIHNDANDYNVLVTGAPPAPARVTGLIDFGDMVQTQVVCEPAVAAAYAMMGKPDPLQAAAQVIGGYHAAYPLTEAEISVVFSLICMRLCTSVVISAYQHKQEPDNAYLTISREGAWALLEHLDGVAPGWAHYCFRDACGLPPCPQTAAVTAWLEDHADDLAPLTADDPQAVPVVVFDLSVGSPDLDAGIDLNDPSVMTEMLFGQMAAAGASVGVGRYDEARLCYTAEQFRTDATDSRTWRTIHLGLDLFMEAGTHVLAPLDGTVHSFHDNDAPLDYGPTVILQHEPADGVVFYTLYGHLNRESLQGLRAGQVVRKGERVGMLGETDVNGGWPPHLHFQVITDLLGWVGDFPGVATAAQRRVWLSLCPDPNLLARIPAAAFPPKPASTAALLERRYEHLGPSLSVSYQKPLYIVRGLGQHLYDVDGWAYLDCVNNVCHVGHCHPHVVRAAQRQMGVLNTNTRYLYDGLTQYAERLCATLPDSLSVCFFVNSGSEANDLALRMARTYTGRRDVVVLDGAYHGHVTSLIEISPYKFDGKGGQGAPPYVHKMPMPDRYRGRYRGDGPDLGAQYAAHIREAVTAMPPAAFIAESILSCGGQIVLPDGFLGDAYHHVRAAGGVCIADEVQVGFGRVGTHFWAFETQGVVPDIVTMGKPIGNGHPMAAVVTTPEIAAAFNNGMEYFNTFGGNPVSCAVGMAVLDVIEQEGLQENARRVGTRLLDGMKGLMATHPLIGDVRGLGLFFGFELVLDRETREPAAAHAAFLVERMKERGLLLSTDGPLHNVIKIKPPIVFTDADADRLVQALDEELASWQS